MILDNQFITDYINNEISGPHVPFACLMKYMGDIEPKLLVEVKSCSFNECEIRGTNLIFFTGNHSDKKTIGFLLKNPVKINQKETNSTITLLIGSLWRDLKRKPRNLRRYLNCLQAYNKALCLVLNHRSTWRIQK